MGQATVPSVEPEATEETSIHLHDQNLGITPHEVTSAFVRTLIVFY